MASWTAACTSSVIWAAVLPAALSAAAVLIAACSMAWMRARLAAGEMIAEAGVPIDNALAATRPTTNARAAKPMEMDLLDMWILPPIRANSYFTL